MPSCKRKSQRCSEVCFFGAANSRTRNFLAKSVQLGSGSPERIFTTLPLKQDEMHGYSGPSNPSAIVPHDFPSKYIVKVPPLSKSSSKPTRSPAMYIQRDQTENTLTLFRHLLSLCLESELLQGKGSGATEIVLQKSFWKKNPSSFSQKKYCKKAS